VLHLPTLGGQCGPVPAQVGRERHTHLGYIEVLLAFPFSEWTQVIPNARLCKAVLDRITDRPHIIDTRPRILSVSPHDRRRQKKG
jgi:hypothetical protein